MSSASFSLRTDAKSQYAARLEKLAVSPMDGTGLRPIPGVDPKYVVLGWTPDGASLYLFSSRASDKAAKVYRVNPATGKMDFWKEFGGNLQSVGNSVGRTSSWIGPVKRTPTSTFKSYRKPTPRQGEFMSRSNDIRNPIVHPGLGSALSTHFLTNS